MQLVFLSKMRAGLFKVSPGVKILWRIYFSQKYHKKRIFNIYNNQHVINHKVLINGTKYVTFSNVEGFQQNLNKAEILHKAKVSRGGIEHSESKMYPVRLLY